MATSSKTVFITGTSSGIGLEAALYFYEQGWNVIATMRQPEKRHTKLHEKGLPDIVHLDVQDAASIQSAVQYTLDKYQRIDVLVNNAGYALYGPFEATEPAQVKRQFDTNVFGLMEVTRAVLPIFRRQKAGVLVNVASMVGRFGAPLYALYCSTKWAVEGFSEALHYELKPLNIKVRIVEPGVIQTDFYDRSMDFVKPGELETSYGQIMRRAEKSAGQNALKGATAPRIVAQTIFRAATDTGGRVRYVVGPDAGMILTMARLLPEAIFYRLTEANILDDSA
jgi:NAD(P)-dependent dehydrogenase (short-subunit alcohol dehydrogenase family)